MAIDIITEKYRDMFGVNPKYWNIINTKLNDADCMSDFTFLVNYALKSIISPDGWNHFYCKDNDGYWYCNGISTRGLYNMTGLHISGTRMMRFVRAGLMIARKSSTVADKSNEYYFVDDFFTTNDVSIKFKLTNITL